MMKNCSSILRSTSCRAVSRFIGGSIAALLVAHSAQAGNTWTGGGASTNWTDTNNWGGSAPNYGTLTFTNGGTQGTTSVLNGNFTSGGNTNMNQLLWTGSSSWTINNSGGFGLSLFDNGGTQAKVENQSTGLVTINAPITFAATAGAAWGEINAVNGGLTFGTGTLTVNGSQVAGIRMFGGGQTTTFNNTVSASGKYFATNAANMTVAIGGSFSSGDFYLMNNGTLKITSASASFSTSGTTALRLGGDFGTTGSQNLAQGATFQLTPLTGGITVNALINTVGSNTSGNLLIDSQNTSGTNTLAGDFYLDSDLKMQQAAGGTLNTSATTLDLKNQTMTVLGNGTVGLAGVVGNSTGSGKLVLGTNGTASTGTLKLSSANTYSGDTTIRAGTLEFATATAKADNSTIRLGSSSGTNVDASINLSLAAGGLSIGSVINPVTTSGTGTITLNSQNTSGTNTYSGHIGLDRNFTITQSAGGTLNATSVHTGADTGNVLGTDIKGFTLTVTPASTGTINYSGTIYNSTGSGAILMNGAGTLILSNANTFTGGITFAAGTTRIDNASALNTTALGGTLKFTGGILQYGSGITTDYSANARMSNSSGQDRKIDTNGNNVTFGSALTTTNSLTGTLTKLGAGTLTLGSSSSRYLGATTIGGGTLSIGSLANAPDQTATFSSSLGGSTNAAANLVLDGGTLQYSGASVGSTDRLFTLTNNGGGLDASGTSANTAAFTNTGAIAYSGSGTRTLALSGSNTGANTLAPILADGTGGATSLSKTGAGTWVLTGANTYTGTTTITAGNLTLGAGGTTGSLSTSSAITDNGTLTFNRSNAMAQGTDFSAGITGSGGVTQAGTGTTTLSGTNSYTGTTAISAGVLRLNSAGALPGGVGVSGGTSGLTLSGGVLGLTTASGDFTRSVGTGSNQVQWAGAGGFAAYGGDRSVNLGNAGAQVSWTSSGTFGNAGLILGASDSDSKVTVVNGMDLNNATRTVTVNDGSATVDASLSGVLAGGGSGGKLTKAGTGTLALEGANTYGSTVAAGTAATTISAGTLQIGNGGATGSISAGGDISVSTGATLAFNRNNALAVSNIITGSGAVKQIGTGTTTLSAASTYTGATTVSVGTLALASTGVLTATTSVAVNSGGTLMLGGSNQINDSAGLSLNGGTFNANGFSETLGALTLTNDSVIDFGGPGSSILTFAGSTGLWTANKTLSIWNWSGNTLIGGGTDQLRFVGNGLDATQLAHIDFYSDGGVNKISITPGFGANGFVSFGEVVPVPEPSGVILAMGLLSLAGWREGRQARMQRRAERIAAVGGALAG